MKRFKFLTYLFLLLIAISGNLHAKNGIPVVKEVLGDQNGSEVSLFTLTNKSGNVLKLTNYGARIVCIEVPDKDGVKDNVTMGSQTLETILRGDAFGGATIGRYANRIGNAKFTLDGKVYDLPVNNRPNTLHGGRGWYSKVWNAEILSSSKVPAVKFSYVSPDMEEGFPGTVNISVVFSWTDKKTVLSVTNHAYFNLHGAGKGYIFDHILKLSASNYTPFNSTKIPTGEILPVIGTPFDFTVAHAIGDKVGETFENAVFDSYDHNFVLDKKAKIAAEVYDPQSGRVMEVITDQPGMQFYSGSGAQWKRAAASPDSQVKTRSSFALETQHFPDSPNQPGFPTTVLNPGEKFKSRTIYRFSVRQ